MSIIIPPQLTPFKYWCQHVVPYVLDDSLSNYEVMCKVVEYLNTTMTNVNILSDDFQQLYNEFISLQKYVENYFGNLDVQDEINKKLDQMVQDGTLKNIINPIVLSLFPPLLVDNISDMTDKNRIYILKPNSHVYTYANGEWVDSGIIYGNGIGNVLTYIGNYSGESMDSIPVQTISVVPYDFPGNPFSPSTSAFVYTIGDNNKSTQQIAISFNKGKMSYRRRLINGSWDVWNMMNDFTNYIQYIGTYNGESVDTIPVQTVCIVLAGYEGNPFGNASSAFIYTFGNENGITQQLAIRFSTGKLLYRRRLSNNIWESWQDNTNFNGYIKYTGLYTGNSADTIPIQTACVLSAGYEGNPFGTASAAFFYTIGDLNGSTQQFAIRFDSGKTLYRRRLVTGLWENWQDNINNDIRYTGSYNGESMDTIPVQTVCVISANFNGNPFGNTSAFTYTIGEKNGSTQQIAISFNNGSVMYRRRLVNNTWDLWRNLSNNSNTYGNTNAHMLSVGNSILNGSVWINGSFNHLATYNNAPYGVIANAINIPKNNVENHLYSSTGLLYDNGEGNFITNIKSLLKPIDDVVLTMLWRTDMTNYQLGNTNSTANDGTIAGAVVDLVNYLKDNNPRCQLILIGVPPVSVDIRDNNAFTGNFPNGNNLSECEQLMQQLSDKYHFIFVGWQGLNMSYRFSDFTDGLNVHANSEDAYRIIGAYLGGVASSKLNF